ncbi:hypothetical protein BGZ60DRAFT_534244 [Tricladium varicosporioides]|nr:hypothetical protein BGZ60DRAFT_534244 [Hymenoscyphus varicosporioides]
MAEVLAIVGVIPALAHVARKGLSDLREIYQTKQEIAEVLENVATQIPLLLNSLLEIEKRIRIDSLQSAATEEPKLFPTAHQADLMSIIKACQEEISKLNILVEKFKPSANGSRTIQVSKKIVAWRMTYGKRFKSTHERIKDLRSSLEGYVVVRTGAIINESLSLARLERKAQISEWLQPSRVEFFQTRLEGTCQWIWSENTFVQWLDIASPRPDRLLCIHGVHGSGKSVLASSIVEGLTNRQLNPLFFSFSGVDSNRKTLEHMLRTLLWQQLQQTQFAVDENIINGLMMAGSTSPPRLVEALRTVANQSLEPIYCVVDGIDESDDEWNSPNDGGLRLVLELLHTLPGIRLLLLGRPAALWGALRETSLNIEINSQVVKDDILSLIHNEVAKLPNVHTPELRSLVSQTLSGKSDGMFLWAKMMLKELQKAANVAEIETMLSELPRGLNKAYQFVFTKLYARLSRIELLRAQGLLKIVITACRPLTTIELCHAYAVESGSVSDFDKRLMTNPDQGVLDVCGDFVIISHGVVRLGHISVRDFLTQPESQFNNEHQALSTFQIDVETANQCLALSFLGYMNHCELGFPLRDPNSLHELPFKYPLLSYISRYIILYITRSGAPTAELIEKVDAFISSRQSTAWIEYFVLLLFQDSSNIDFEDDFSKLKKWYNASKSNSRCLTDIVKDRWQQELSFRMTNFGAQDIRTKLWHDTISITNIEEPLAAEDTLVESTPLETTAEVSQLVKILGSPELLTIQRQAQILLGLSRFARRIRVLSDPLQSLFGMIVSAADRIPVFGLIGIGDFYERLNKLDEALKMYQIALAKVQGDDTIMECKLLQYIRVVYSTMEKYDKAEEFARCEILKRERILGDNHTKTIQAKDNLCYYLYCQKNYEAAADYALVVKNARESSLGPRHHQTLDSYNFLGEIYHYLDNHEEAEKCFAKELEGRQATDGYEHPTTLSCLDWLATQLDFQEKYKESEARWLDLCDRRTKSLGSDADLTLDSIEGFADSLDIQGRYQESQLLYEKLVATMERTNGVDHKHTCRSLMRLAVALGKQGKNDLAIIKWRDVLKREERMEGKEGRHTISALVSLSRELYYADEFQESLQGFREALKRIEGHDDSNDKDDNKLKLTENIATTLDGLELHVDAELKWRHVLLNRQTSLGNEHHKTLGATEGLAHCLGRQGRHTESEILWRGVLEIDERINGKGTDITLWTMQQLAECLTCQKRYEDAEVYYGEIARYREEAREKGHPITTTFPNDLNFLWSMT